jgi:hypothetical protein
LAADLFCKLGLPNGGAGCFKKTDAGIGERDAPFCLAVQEPHAKACFKRADLIGECGRGNIQPNRGAAEMKFFSNRNKVA